MMRYKIGDVSRILDISTDLLRYYEKKGVVTPVKDRNNDYRYYDTWDINFLIDCIWYKNFGFGIEQIAHMVSDCPYDGLLGMLDEKKEEIKEAIRHQELLLQRIGEHVSSISKVREYIGKCDLRLSPDIVCYLNRYNFLYDNSAELQKLSQQWMKYMPFTQRYFEISREGILGNGEDYAWGFSLDRQYVEAFDVPINPPVAHYPPEICIHSAFKSTGKDAFTPRHLDYVMDFVEEKGLRLSGGARGNLVCSVLEDRGVTGYFEVWLPVEEKARAD